MAEQENKGQYPKEIAIEEAPRGIIETAARVDGSADSITAYRAVGYNKPIYTIRNDDLDVLANVTENGRRVGHLWGVEDQYSDPWMPGAENGEQITEEMFDELRDRGRFIRAIDPQGNRLVLQERAGVLTHAHYHEHDDGVRPQNHPCFEAIQAHVMGESVIPFDPGWYATVEGDREIDSRMMVNVFADYKAPYFVRDDYSTREAFIGKLVAQQINIPTASLAIGSKLFVPQSDVELVQNRYEEYAKDTVEA